jgi:hypothetical protein
VIHVRDVRRLALSLPETTEEDHFGRPSFRVRGRIFATLPDFEHLNVMIDPFDVEGVVQTDPAACEALWWGKSIRGVRVRLPVVTPELMTDLLTASWRSKAPRTLLG